MGGSRVTQIISAKTGNIIEKKNSKGEYEKSVRLKDGFVLEWNEKKDGFVVTDFMGGEMDYNIPTEKEKTVIGFNIKPETFSFPLLIKIRNSIQSEGLEEIPGLEILKEMNISIKGVDGLNQLVEKMKMEIILDSQKGTVSSSEMSNRYAVFTQLQGLLKDTKKTLIAFNVLSDFFLSFLSAWSCSKTLWQRNEFYFSHCIFIYLQCFFYSGEWNLLQIKCARLDRTLERQHRNSLHQRLHHGIANRH